MAESILEGVFMNIPTPIITDILARLPPKAVIRCSCVCKPWLYLISEPQFVNLHLSKSPKGLIVCKNFPWSTHSVSYSLVEIEDETDHHGVRRIVGTDREIPKSPSRINTRMTIIGSIDGLVCIKEYSVESEVIRVWNPIMGELITVETRGEEHGLYDKTTYGFGISRGKYLVVKILQIHKTKSTDNTPLFPDSTCHVYTIGDGVWKSIGHAPYLYNCHHHGIFVNGNLHWIVCYDGRQISCLDLEKDLFQPFPPVPELYEGAFATLNLYKGCLSVCYNTSDSDIVIWAMKEYGVQKSWSKEVVISRHDLINLRREYEVVSIIKVFKDGEILLFWSANFKLFSYHPKRKILQDMDDKESMIIGPSNYNPYKFHPCIEATEYVSSLVSLKSLGEVNVSRC